MSPGTFEEFFRDFFRMAPRDAAADARPHAEPSPPRRVVVLLRGDDDYHRLFLDGGDTDGTLKLITEAMAAAAPIVTVGKTTLRVAAIDAVYEAVR